MDKYASQRSYGAALTSVKMPSPGAYSGLASLAGRAHPAVSPNAKETDMPVPKVKLSDSAAFRSVLSEQEWNNVSNLFATRGKAWPEHETLLKEQASEPDESAFHSIPRHGPQTGWESQLIRLVTGRTPDQPEDPMGVKDAVEKYRRKESLPLKERGKIRYAKANSVGAFLSPEVEMAAITLARAKADPLMKYRYAETTAGNATQWQPFDYIDVVVRPPYGLAGVSFYRSKNATKLVESDAVQAIEDFVNSRRITRSASAKQSGRTWERTRDILRGMDEEGRENYPHYRMAAKRDFGLRFTSMQDLLDHLEVSAIWMKYVNVALRLIGNAWLVHTAYAVGGVSYVATGDEVGDVKQTFAAKPKCEPTVKSGKWTGKLKTTETGPEVFINPASLL
ncbi:hypothetical protein [Paraburkholderia sp. UCT2]|uniref:hypothetical protein n=1 Tax=Paraburkholderia sp. UCT2 TaxID=2615208 RepID=UPI0016551500|nr:hypothetical protein [Paraburkholderia sp. UCT2]MBC8732807.1 hypothetical protein [Paraburkholderia sp. UCT2]